jgi:putative nucleotidyltransferase with HDIG domain
MYLESAMRSLEYGMTTVGAGGILYVLGSIAENLKQRENRKTKAGTVGNYRSMFSDLQVDLHELIVCITSIVDAKDVNTMLHSKRVADMSQTVCRLLKLNTAQEEQIHIAAHFHDIGKIGVQDAVLLKDGPLTPDEWNMIKKHPDIGANILASVSGFEKIARFVRYHHERYDGSGYPAGLKGEKIPYGSRIISICDSIDAMLSDRNYRKAINKADCYTEIKKNIGSMYDPDIGRVVLAHWNDIIAARKDG